MFHGLHPEDQQQLESVFLTSREAAAAGVCECVVCVCVRDRVTSSSLCWALPSGVECTKAVTPPRPCHPLVQSLKLSQGDYNYPCIAFTENPLGLTVGCPSPIVGSLGLSGVEIHRRHRDMYPQSSLNIKDISVRRALLHYYKTAYFLINEG